MSRCNIPVHAEFLTSPIPKWRVAEKMGLSDSGFSRLLRKELEREKQEEIIGIIHELEKEDLLKIGGETN